MKNIKVFLSNLILISNISCGVCIPTNLEFKNKKKFNTDILNNISTNSEYIQTAAYEATRDLKTIINTPRKPSNIIINFQPNGFIKADFWPSNSKNEQGIIYKKRGIYFLDKIGADQDRCKFIETYRLKIEKNRVILIQFGGIFNQKNVYEYTKVN